MKNHQDAEKASAAVAEPYPHDTTSKPGSAEASHPDALSFDGERTYVAIPTFRYDGSYPLTLEATVRPAKVGGDTILADTEFAGFRLSSSYFAIHDGHGYVEVFVPTPPATNEWVDVAVVFDFKEASFFLNGKQQATRPSIDSTRGKEASFTMRRAMSTTVRSSLRNG
ncbi:MAG: hypothetical protein H0T47_07825 [Planctomycetaceae bacterium]|nr:hypothetical protein [Planctomycetaceae bacterium]